MAVNNGYCEIIAGEKVAGKSSVWSAHIRVVDNSKKWHYFH